MTRTLLALALALTTLSPTLAFAQDPEPRVEVFDDADLVTGSLESPMVDMIHVRGGARRHTLISPRSHYLPERLRSVENL